MKYGIGIDAGIASVGHAVMLLDENDEPYRIYGLSSRIFDAAEQPKTGASLAAPRREKRDSRRTLRRKKHRKERIRYLLLSENILSETELINLYKNSSDDIYRLRFEGLEKELSNTEWAKVLIHLSQRRGFKSNRKNEATDKETGKLLSAIDENKKRMNEKGYKTIGEMFYKDEQYHHISEYSEKPILSYYTRNKSGEHIATVTRDMVEDEIRILFDYQRKFGNKFANEKIEKQYCDIVLSQRPFDLGPGKMPNGEDSPYGGNIIEKMIGKCSFFPEELRACKATYSFMLFTLWQKINNIRIINQKESRCLDETERKIIFDLAHSKKTLNYSGIRKALKLDDIWRFNTVYYKSENLDEDEKKEKFEYLKPYHQIKTALDKYEKGYIKKLSVDELDIIGTAFTIHKDDKKITKYLKDKGIDEKLFESLLTLSGFSKTGHLSVKACRLITPFLEQGDRYDVACEKAGIDFKSHQNKEKSVYLNPNSEELTDITNPVVKRSVSQIIKVINAIIREMGNSPTYINIELARDLSKTRKERDKIEKNNAIGKENNQKIVEEIKEHFNIISPSGMDIIKMKLFHEQGEICPYSGSRIEYNRIFESGYVEVDHIKPYSISFDDSFINKVLVKSEENRMKSNRLPLEYLAGKRKDDYRVWVNCSKLPRQKKLNLLKESITEEDKKNFKERNLNDTKYISRLLYNLINDHLLFEDFSNGRKKHVCSVNGSATAYMRKRWGIKKIREEGDLHHAVDAAVVTCTTDGMIQKISKYSKYKETKYSDNAEGSLVVNSCGEVIDEFPYPYPEFRKELDIRTSNNPAEALKYYKLSNYSYKDIENVKPCFVSRMPKRKVKGAAHADTVFSAKKPGYGIKKVDLNKLKLNKSGEIEGYYQKEDDTLLYNALVNRLKMFDGNGKEAFPEGYVFHKPKSDGSPGPVVKKVKIEEKSTLNVPVCKNNGKFTGIANNDSMVRIDVFYVKNDGYYFIPIYVADTLKKELPNKACVANKDYEHWKEMNDSDFIFSLYPNDLIKISAKNDISFNLTQKDAPMPDKKSMNDVLVYYNGADISSGRIVFILHDNSYWGRIGLKTLKGIEKYTVDVLGNINKVKKEKRVSFNKGK